MTPEETIQQLQRELQKQKKINAVLIARVEQGVSDGGGAFAMFERAVSLEKQVKDRTLALSKAMQQLDEKNSELESANARLLDIDKMKSDFLSSVSHELRTPLTSIRGFASLIEREFSRSFAPLAGTDAKLQKNSARIVENVGIILKESERLTRLINDVLDLAKIESGRIGWHDAVIGIGSLVGDAVSAVQGMFNDKPSVALRQEVQEGLPAILGDADRLQQVIVNLVSNAAKFTEQGEVRVAAFLNGEGMIQLEVRDSGIGFPPEDAEKIFDKFQQSNQGDTLANKPKGTGLGLAIAREIVERHGGRIWASSVPGQGSVFAVTLPPAVEQPEAAPLVVAQASSPAASAAEKLKVLVVDDDPAVCRYLTQLLQEEGYEVATAGDGHTALAVAAQYRPHLITMDLAMPVMDGPTAIARLRADPDLRHIPIMVVSAMSEWASAGGDAVLCKPIEEASFLYHLHSLLGRDVQPPRTLQCLLLYDGGSTPNPESPYLSSRCEVQSCSLHNLTSRLQQGFQGMVIVPADLIDRVDLPGLQATPSLEIMIMPMLVGTERLK